MHIITKFLVILTSVLAVLLAGLTVAYSANADRVVQEMQSARNAATAEKTRADAAEARLASNQDAKNQELLALKASIETQNDTVRDLEDELAAARAEITRLQLSEQQYANRIDQFVSLSEQDKKLREEIQAELRALRGEVNDQARRIIDLVDRNADLVSQNEALENQSRALSEQLAQARRGSSSTGAVAALPDSFRARVTNVIEDADGSILVEINAGTSDRLSEGMSLIAVRGSTYLGTIELMRVDLNEAVGRVTQAGNGTIRNDDVIRPGA
ncbi:MAG: hypothetical protein Tsb0013_20490 [Phycisphaerales bacterium]